MSRQQIRSFKYEDSLNNDLARMLLLWEIIHLVFIEIKHILTQTIPLLEHLHQSHIHPSLHYHKYIKSSRYNDYKKIHDLNNNDGSIIEEYEKYRVNYIYDSIYNIVYDKNGKIIDRVYNGMKLEDVIYNDDYVYNQNDRIKSLFGLYINEKILTSIYDDYLDIETSKSKLDCISRFPHSKSVKKISKRYQLRRIVGPLEYLMVEAHKLIDMDDNGYIFGWDWIFKDDFDITPYFRRINIDPVTSYTIPQLVNLKKYLGILPELMFCPTKDKEIKSVVFSDFESYDDFKIRIYGKGEEFMIIVPQVTESEIIEDLQQEFNTGIDHNNDGLVFGKDFILLNAPPELMTLVPPFMPNIILSWNAFKLKEYYYPKDSPREDGYYIDLLNQELVYKIDKDGNDEIYGIDFHIIDDLKGLDECIPGTPGTPITWNQYLDTIRPYICTSYEDMEEFTVKLSVEFYSQEDLDNNDLIYGIDFLISDYDDAKTDCLWQIETDRACTITRDIPKLTQIRNKYGFSTQMVVDYTQVEFDSYWNNISGTIVPEMQDCTVQNSDGFIIQNGQIVSYCVPIFKNKKKMYPMFIPIISWCDYLEL